MEVRANTKYLRISPKKMRLVVDAIRGMNVSEAFDYLNFMPQKAARIISKTLRSAAANAEHNFSLKQDNLFIKSIVINQGPSLKRWRSRAFGRAAPIRKHSSHISVILESIKEGESVVSPKEKLKEPVIQSRIKEKLEEQKVEEKGKDMPTKIKQKVKKIFDVRRKGKRRAKQHLDKVRAKGKGGRIKQMFRRKSI